MRKNARVKRSTVTVALVLSGLLAAGSGSAVTTAATSGSLALATDNSIPGPGLYRLDLGSRRLTRLTTQGSDGWPTWSRDGKRIAFIRGQNGGRLFIVNSDGSGLHAVGNAIATSASWGPGDKQIAIGDGKGISILSPDGSGLKRLRLSAGGGALDQSAWSPNGRTILFSWAGHGIYAMRADGSGAHAIVKRPKPSGPHLYQLSAPAWAPNGKRISFVQTDLLAITSGPLIKTANPDGSRRRTVARAPAGYLQVPTWSTDSSSIAFAGSRGGQQGVFVVPSSGGKARLLYGGNSGTIWNQPSWGPAGG